MDDMDREYLSTLDTASIDGFRSLLYKGSDDELERIYNEQRVASGPHEDWLDDDGVQAVMIRRLGEELVLIHLYHSVELKIKEIIKCRRVNVSPADDKKLYQWEKLKESMSNKAKDSDAFRQVNIMRLLVNCFKHVGRVSKKLHEIDETFGYIGDDIVFDRRAGYERYKDSSSKLIRLIYENES